MKKYKYLTKEDKNKLKNDFFQTDIGKANKPRFMRLTISSILLLIYSVYLIVDNILNDNSIWPYTLAAICIISAVVFLLGKNMLLTSFYNTYLNETKVVHKTKKK